MIESDPILRPPPRAPGRKLLFVVLIAAALAVPLMTVYALVWDRQDQSRTARAAITSGWGGAQTISGPVVVIPYSDTVSERTVIDGKEVDRLRTVTRELFLSPQAQQVSTTIEPRRKRKSIYDTVLYTAKLRGTAQFALPADLERQGVKPSALMLDRAELRFGVSDPRGLESASVVQVNGAAMATRPGKGLAATGQAGFFGFLETEGGAWNGQQPLAVSWSYDLRGSETLSLVPRGGDTRWQVSSPWPHPGFSGSFLPSDPDISDAGFKAAWSVPDLALGQGLVQLDDSGPPVVAMRYAGGGDAAGMAATIGLVEPVDLYSRIDRAVKYGFLIIGFTFLTFLMFDIVAGVPVAAAEYLLTGAGLVLFFVLLLAFSEVIGFAGAYAVASVAIIGLITAYGAAVLKSWGRARVVGALLTGLYALLFVLLSLEAWSLLIGSVLLFVALAGVMYATRDVQWSGMARGEG